MSRLDGLTATDARWLLLGVTVHATRDGFRYALDDRRAVSGHGVDPLIRQARLSASDGAAGDGLGASVATDGTTIAVGAPGATVNAIQQGAVYVFVKPASGWADSSQPAAKLTASDVASGDGGVYGVQLGSSVAMAGDTIVATAPRAPSGGQLYAGKVYVFVKPSGGWTNATQTAQFGALDATANDQMGTSVATNGTTVVAGLD